MFRTALAALAAVSCAASAAAQPAPRNLDLAGMDRTVRPGDDFYAYANGGWLKRTTLTDGQASLGPTDQLRALNHRRVTDLVRAAAAEEKAAGETGRNPLARKVGDYYASLTDEAGIEAKGLAPLARDLAAIAAITDRRGLAAWLGATLAPETDGVTANADHTLGLYVGQGFDQAERNVAHLWQGGLGLADRDAYLNASADATARRATYQAHVAAVLRLAGAGEDAEARAARVLALEVAIAKSHAPDADAADVAKQNNPWTRADFAARAPGLDWDAWFAAAGLAGQPVVVVWQPSAVTGLAALAGSGDLAVWRDYLNVRLVDHYAAVLPKAAAEHAAAAPREQTALAMTEGALGQAVGQLYVRRQFPPQAKAAARAMTDGLLAAWKTRLTHAGWLSPSARRAALEKLAALQVGLGYPDAWIDYAGFEVVRGDAFGNLRRAEAFSRARSLARLGRPIDPIDWPIDPQAVGAVILFSPNAELFAAGILQPPYFDPKGDAAANYGSAGAGIAHEIGHSFDELGHIYDAHGRLGDWWTQEDRARHAAASAKVAAQFDAACPRPGLCVKGAQVAGEAIADLGGLEVAHEAYVASLKGRPDAVIAGLTGEQRFFVAFAQRWRKLQTDDALARQVAGDIHAPPQARSNAVRNVAAWYKAFGVKPGDRLYLKPADRVGLW